MPKDAHGAGGKIAGEEAPGQGEASDRRWNTAGEIAADPPFVETEGVPSGEQLKHFGEVKHGEDNKRGDDCDESPAMPSQILANVLGEGFPPIGANAGLERTSASSAEPAAWGKALLIIKNAFGGMDKTCKKILDIAIKEKLFNKRTDLNHR